MLQKLGITFAFMFYVTMIKGFFNIKKKKFLETFDSMCRRQIIIMEFISFTIQ